MLLIVFSKNTFKLFYLKQFYSTDVVTVEGKKYTIDSQSKENNAFIGFYDWLRSKDAQLVGVRMCFFEHHGYNKFLEQLSNVQPTFDGRCMELMFGNEEYKPEISGDQDFGNNYVYVSNDDEYLITFSTDHLDMQELDSLLSYCSKSNSEIVF